MIESSTGDLEERGAPSPAVLRETAARPQSRTRNTRKARTAAASALSGAERERLRDALHDGLGQLLTSISFLASSLQQKLKTRELPEADEAREIVTLTGRAISETQALVNPASPVSPP
jgi:signal transduction histidine kinase